MSPSTCPVFIEIPRGSFLKMEQHRGNWQIRFLSPLPCPFNYGTLPDTVGADGEEEDAILLGPRKARGLYTEGSLLGYVRFVDQGEQDDKALVSEHPIRRRERLLLVAFFQLYARVKALARLDPCGAETRFDGLELL